MSLSVFLFSKLSYKNDFVFRAALALVFMGSAVHTILCVCTSTCMCAHVQGVSVLPKLQPPALTPPHPSTHKILLHFLSGRILAQSVSLKGLFSPEPFFLLTSDFDGMLIGT